MSTQNIFYEEIEKKKQKTKKKQHLSDIPLILSYDIVLTFTILLINSADEKLVIFFLFFPENRI